MKSENAKFGISVKMPKDDPMCAPHLLGEDWAGSRWFSSEQERDSVLREMQDHPRYYRKGDSPSVILERIER